jgi:hypothetical protein
MIEVNELRIGNYVEWLQDSPFVVRDLTRGGAIVLTTIDTDSVNVKMSQSVSGIELTEQWLIKFGFKIQGVTAKYYTKNNVDIWNLNGVWATDMDLPITSVHQLQNYYFALTQKELVNNH